MSADARPEHDPFLTALRGERAPATLTERDVAAHLQCSVRLLQDWRQKGTRPPHWAIVNGKLVRYPTAEFVKWLDELARTSLVSTKSTVTVSDVEPAALTSADGLDEPVFRGGRRKKTHHATFSTFINAALPNDEWLFVLRGQWQRPIDYVGSFDLERHDDDEIVWLTLHEYLDRLKRAAAAEASASSEATLKDVVRGASAGERGGRL